MPETANPYIAGSPVTGTEMFFGREDVFTSIRQALTGQHRDHVIVLYGQRRSGKTSVLYQMRRQLDARYLPIFIDLHGLALNGLDGLLWELASHITRVLRREYQIELALPKRDDFAADARSAFEEQFLDSVWAALGDRHLLLMLDEAIRLQEQVQAGKLEKEIFEYLRHLMQHYERLNFLFSLGSGLEQMEKEYAFLFNVALYQKISFLSRDAVVKLITEPVQGIYTVEAAAVEHILDLTSGHPYYTQLLCHLLFNRAQSQGLAAVTVSDVDAVLEEGVERGLAVLKHPWDESTPAEKAVMAGMAALTGGERRGVTSQEIQGVWNELGVAVPDGQVATAIQKLIARDLVVGTTAYTFTVELQRLWTQRYKRLEWVKEEIADAVTRWSPLPVVTVAEAMTAEQLLAAAGEQKGVNAAAPGRAVRMPVAPVKPRRWLPLLIALGVGALVLLVLAGMAVYEIGRGSVPIAQVPAGSSSGLVLSGDAALVTDMTFTAHRVWAATGAGLVRWDADGNGKVFPGNDLGFGDACVQAVALAPDGSLWLGCGGVAHVQPNGDVVNRLAYYSRDDGLGMGVVRAVLVDSDGTVWAGGAPDNDRDAPLTRYDGKKHENGKEWQPDQPLNNALARLDNVTVSVTSLLRARDGALWIGMHEDGILRWDGNNLTRYGPAQGVSPDGLDDRRIRRMVQDANGTIWAAASDQGLLKFDAANQRWVNPAPPDQNVPVRGIAVFADRTLWVGGDNLVARSTDGGQTWSVIGSGNEVGRDIGSIVQDGTGHIWAGAYDGGVFVLVDGTWKALQR